MADTLLIKKGKHDNLPEAKVNGQILFTTDKGNLYIDDDGSRIQVNAGAANALLSPNDESKAYLDWTGEVSTASWFGAWDNTTYNAPTVRAMSAENMRTNLDVPTRTGGNASGNWGINITGNAATATALTTATAGDANTPVYFKDGKPVVCTSLDLNTSGSSASCTGNAASATVAASCTGNAATATALTTATAGDTNTPVYFKDGKPVACTSLDLNTSGSSASCTGNAATATALTTTTAGDSNTPVYFKNGKPVACTSLDLNTSGSSASCTGNASTATTAAKLGRGGNTANPMTFNWSGQDGQPSWLWGGSDGTNMYVYNPSNFSVKYASGAGYANCLSSRSDITYGWNGLQYFNESLGTTASATGNYAPTADWYHIIRMNHSNANGYYVDLAACFHNDNLYMKRVANGANSGYKHIWVEGNSVTSAVWNDYAEYRESDCEEFGRVLVEKGDDTLTKSTERLAPFCGVSSDTWGFCQGETEKAKTPIAVAGRVLVYPYQDRNNYKPGDCVCAAPNGTVDIMTREEVKEWPDRIVGTVSCIPDYEEWGSGDRDPVKVNGRIWIKVR